jgi:pimeloyl-ACP methyl ester carboxylesterase
VVLNRSGADEEPRPNLRVRQPVPREPGDLVFLSGQPSAAAGRLGTPERGLPGGLQFPPGSRGERGHSHRLQHVVRRAQLLAGLGPAPLPPQPFPVQQVRAGKVRAHPRPAEPVDRFAVTALGGRTLGHQRPRARLDTEGPLRPLAVVVSVSRASARAAVTPADAQVYGNFLRDPAHLEASFDWFRTFPQDIKDDAVDQQTKLTMPVLAIGADHSLGAAEANQVKQYATNVTGMVIKNSGHWIYEEHSAEMTQILLNFLH